MGVPWPPFRAAARGLVAARPLLEGRDATGESSLNALQVERMAWAGLTGTRRSSLARSTSEVKVSAPMQADVTNCEASPGVDSHAGPRTGDRCRGQRAW